MASLFSLCPHCAECPEVVITDEGVTIKETANVVRLRSLMSEIRAAPRKHDGWWPGKFLVGKVNPRKRQSSGVL